MRTLVIKAHGEIREYPLDTPIERIIKIMENAIDFAIIEYKGGER